MRKTIKFVSVITIIILLSACNGQSKKDTNASLDTTISKIEVLDFHSTHRCMTCNAIEKNTKYTLKCPWHMSMRCAECHRFQKMCVLTCRTKPSGKLYPKALE